MNLREGTRRLALLLGVIGAILGGFASYLDLDLLMPQLKRHNKFVQLTNSDLVKQEQKCRSLGYASDCSQIPPPPPGFVLDKPKYSVENADGTPLDSELNKGGIKTIHWTKDYAVASIETDSASVYAEPAPNAWEYFLAVLFPVFGFIIPWGTVRAIGWVGVGFVQKG